MHRPYCASALAAPEEGEARGDRQASAASTYEYLRLGSRSARSQKYGRTVKLRL
jgi:hypothetical protein